MPQSGATTEVSAGSGPKGTARGGFTLVELMVVVVIVAILAAAAAAALHFSRVDAENTVFAANMRHLCSAFRLYQAHEGDWPEDQPVGVAPPGMQAYLKSFVFSAETPIGGRWDWLYTESSGTAGVSVIGPQRTTAQMGDVDALLDDGNVRTGWFRATASGFMDVIESTSDLSAKPSQRPPPAMTPLQ